MAALELYFDFISPYAYLGWTQIHTLAARHGREVRAIPVLFAALLEHAGTLGPAEIPAKRAYIYKDTLRTARVLGVPFSAPPSHPFNPLRALRVATATPTREVISALYRAAWGGGGGVETDEAVTRALDAAGLPGAALAASAGDPAVKQRLREATDAAIAAGVFGVPTVIADGELFWGVDSLSHLERFLAGADPLRPEDAQAFAALRPSATRLR